MGVLAKYCVNLKNIEINFEKFRKIDYQRMFHPAALQLISA